MFCPLDCWDSCNLVLDDEKFKGLFPTPYLCWKLNNYFHFKRETTPKYYGKNIMLNKALEHLADILKQTEPHKVLFVKGSGNMGIMQNITKLFFEKYGATFAVGSTCDGMGEKGIIKGRGKSLVLPTWIIKNAKNIIIWGRNPYVTNIHLIQMIKEKFTITIDAIMTKTAKNSDVYLQINPNSDFYLAILLSQMVLESGNYNSAGENFDEFKKIVFSYKKDDLLDKCSLSYKQVEVLYNSLREGAVILSGLGVAKCKECWKTTWAIDSLAHLLGFFGKEDRGVAFLGSSGYGLNNPFEINHKNQVPLWDVNLDDYDAVFIQGANPLVSFVNRDEWEKLKEKTTIVFGKYMDETAEIAKLFIPTKDFYEKKDVRGSYFHEFVLVTEKLCHLSNDGISEYELTQYLMEKFGFGGLKSEDEYIDEILNAELVKVGSEVYRKKIFDSPPYKDRFFTKSGKFYFLTEKFKRDKKEFEVVSAKEAKALNSQFKRDEFIYMNPNSKNIMLRFLKEHFNEKVIKYDSNLPPDIIFSKGGSQINKILKAKGQNAYYEI